MSYSSMKLPSNFITTCCIYILFNCTVRAIVFPPSETGIRYLTQIVNYSPLHSLNRAAIQKESAEIELGHFNEISKQQIM